MVHEGFEGILFELSFVARCSYPGFYARIEVGLLLLVESNRHIKLLFEIFDFAGS